MKDEKLLRRLEAAGAALVVVAYFLPWASIVSPFGSIQVRGLYVDYAWIVLVMAVGFLLVHLAQPRREALGLPESSQPYLNWYQKLVPFVLIAAAAWYGASYGFNVRAATGGGSAALFGMEVSAVVRAGLDYGFWILASGAFLLLVSAGLRLEQLPRFLGVGLAIVAIVSAIALGLSMPRDEADSGHVESTAGAAVQDAKPERKPVPDFDATPYVEVVSVTGSHHPKNITAGRFSSYVAISPVFKNLSGKTIVGLRGRISVQDGFAREVYSFTFRDDDKLPSGRQSRPRGGYSFEDNQFMHDEPYDKLVNLVTAGTARYTATVTEIAFDDGTVLPGKATE
jgi:hypothetical protein